MSKILDGITTIVGVGIFGYFAWQVLLPQVKTLLQNLPAPAAAAAAPPPSTPAAPAQQQQQQQPASSPSKEEDDDDEGGRPIAPTSSPAAAAATTGGQVLYDSSQGGWKGVTTAASGNPKWSVDSSGAGHLNCGSGHCRVYIAVKNHNARMEGEFMFESGSVDNISLRLRSRHQEGGSCENRFGGFGVSFTPDGGVKFQTESCHNEHENTINGKASGAISKGTWHKFAYSCFDSADKKSVNFRMDIDGKTVLTGKHPSPKPYYMDEALHMKNSYIWIRSNNSGTGSIAIRNFKVIKIGAGGSGAVVKNIQAYSRQPYLYNSFFNRRRM
jgi:hypothetical protein